MDQILPYFSIIFIKTQYQIYFFWGNHIIKGNPPEPEEDDRDEGDDEEHEEADGDPNEGSRV